jgi:hypothetical protein
MAGKTWGEYEIQYLKDNTSLTKEQISNNLGRSCQSVRLMACKLELDLAIGRKRQISFTEDDFIKSIKSSKTNKEAISKLGYENNNSVSLYKEMMNKIKPDISHFSNISLGSFIKKSNLTYEYKLYYNIYKAGAKRRNLKFEIDFELFCYVVNSSCFYCGSDGEIKKLSGSRKTSDLVVGIDRIDSSIGYIDNNILPCCMICNRMKLDYTQENFIKKIIKIYNNLNLGELNTNG